MEGMLMILLYFLNHMNLLTRFANMSSKHQNINFTVEQENINSLSFLDVKICRKNRKFVSSVYWKPIFSGVFNNYESFILTYQKRGLLHTYFIGVLAYVLISRHFILKSIIWRLSYWKTIIPQISLIRVLNHFLISCIHLKLLFQM